MKTIKELEAELYLGYPQTKHRIKALKDVLGLIDWLEKEVNDNDDFDICALIEELKSRING